jgi:hypothetical protein
VAQRDTADPRSYFAKPAPSGGGHPLANSGVMRAVSLVFIVAAAVACSSSKLDGTDLPDDYDECVEEDGFVVGERCTFTVNSKKDPDRFQQCVDVGGGETSDEGGGGSCKIIYPRNGKPCLGNACD